MARNYRKEYDNYHASAKQKKRRACRNAARRIKGGKKGKDVAHKNNNPCDNRKSNLSNQSKSRNRSFARTKTARRKRG